MHMNTLMVAPMVPIHPRNRASVARLSIDEELENARAEFPDWWILYDEFSLLHVPGACHLNTVVELIATAPCQRLAGYVEGLYVNN